MSLVNSNENYLRTMGIYPIQGNARHTTALGGIVAVSLRGSLKCPYKFTNTQVYYGGSLIGALIGGSIADRGGRIVAIILGVTVSIIGAVFQASAMNITWMCCARVVSGLGVGTIDAGEIQMMPYASCSLSLKTQLFLCGVRRYLHTHQGVASSLRNSFLTLRVLHLPIGLKC